MAGWTEFSCFRYRVRATQPLVNRLRREYEFSETGAPQTIFSTGVHDDELTTFAEQRFRRYARGLARRKHFGHRIFRDS